LDWLGDKGGDDLGLELGDELVDELELELGDELVDELGNELGLANCSLGLAWQQMWRRPWT
jgi:hypothetical protein